MSDISRTVRTCKDCGFCSNEFYVLFFMNQPSVKGKLNQVVSSKQKSASTDVLIDNLLVLVIGGRDDKYIYI